ncbi:MAG: hypothetical protein ACREBS_09895, partial [Nitrososphaerales archaeon]
MEENVEPLGEKWYNEFYQSIRNSLGFDQSRDEEARDILSSILSQKNSTRTSDFESVKHLTKSKNVVMFGAGPSLDDDMDGLAKFIHTSKPTIVAA